VGPPGAQAVTARTLVALALLGLSGLACGGEGDPLSPIPTGTADAGAPSDAGPEPKPDAGPVRRTIEQRNPFGNVAEHENLLWDGDFEWSSPFADQYGWINYPQSTSSFGFEGIRVGVACRSGLKCVAVKNKASIIGIAVASKEAGLSASFWAKTAAGDCDGVAARLISIYLNEPGVEIPAPAGPDASGWCHFALVADQQQAKSYFLIENDTNADLLIDDAVLVKVPPMQVLEHAPARPPTAAEIAEDAEVRALARKQRGPHDPPPNPARRAFEAWAKR
jgi:hypothetical protein